MALCCLLAQIVKIHGLLQSTLASVAESTEVFNFDFMFPVPMSPTLVHTDVLRDIRSNVK